LLNETQISKKNANKNSIGLKGHLSQKTSAICLIKLILNVPKKKTHKYHIQCSLHMLQECKIFVEIIFSPFSG
jgi:hypothetical protein